VIRPWPIPIDPQTISLAQHSHSALTLGNRAPRSLGEGPTARDVAIQHAPGRVRQVILDPPVTLLPQIPRHTCKGASRAGRANKRIDGALGLFPYFRAGGEVMYARVTRVVELVCPEGVWRERRSIVACLVVVIGWVLVSDCRDGVDICAEETKKVDLLFAL